ncbi:MAG: RNA ligase family protein [Candidatus Buchananbacteria bacterium]|jgi:hypothetical protein
MIKEDAAVLLDLNPNELSSFEEVDTFNGNLVKGFLSHHTDYRYGALVIFEVNSQPVPIQKIFCTPKLHYPFGKTEKDERKYNHDVNDYEDLVVYEKLDGTNICAFSYADNDKRYQSFKTRLTPFLKDNKYACFTKLWAEMMGKYSDIVKIDNVLSGEYSVCFELYGYRNPLTVSYNTPLDIRFLFAVKQNDHSVVPPKYFDGLTDFRLPEVPVAGNTFVDKYEAMRQYVTDNSVVGEDGMVKSTDGDGMEGYIFYTKIADVWHQYKCKSAQMEEHSWAAGGIPYVSILTTAWNALESCGGDLTEEYVKTLLMEEFTNEQIGRADNKITKAVKEVLVKLAFRTKVLDLYDKSGLKYKFDGANKGTIMRYLSKYFNRTEMAGVYNALKETGILS